MAIKAEISTKTPCEVVIKATVGREELMNAYQESLKKNARQIEMPGFRRGKAPLQMVEERFKEYFENDAMESMVNKVVRSVIKSQRLNVVTEARMAEQLAFPKEGDFSFTAEFEVAPAVSGIEYEGLKLTGRKQEVTEEEVSKEIEMAAERFATYEDVKTDRPAQFGDWCVASYKGVCGEKEVLKRDSAWVEVAQDRKTPAPGFCAELSGMKKGETKTFKLNSGDEFFMKDFANKEVEFTVTVEAIKERVVPEVNEELVKKIDPECKGMEEFRSKVREAFAQNKAESEKARLCELVREQLVKKYQLPLPPYFVAMSANSLLRQQLEQKYRSGVKEEELEALAKELKPKCEEQAKANLIADFILTHIAEKESITLTFEDLMPALQQYSRMFGKPVTWIFRMFEQTGKLDEIRQGVLQQKVLEFIVSKAKVSEGK